MEDSKSFQQTIPNYIFFCPVLSHSFFQILWEVDGWGMLMAFHASSDNVYSTKMLSKLEQKLFISTPSLRSGWTIQDNFIKNSYTITMTKSKQSGSFSENVQGPIHHDRDILYNHLCLLYYGLNIRKYFCATS